MKIDSTLFPHPDSLLRARGIRPTFLENFFQRAAISILTKYYGWIIFSFGTSIIILEAVEHLTPIHDFIPFHYGEIMLIVLLLAISGFLTRMLLSALAERSQAMHILQVKHELGMHLSASQDISELSRRLVNRLDSIVPSRGVELYLYDRKRSWFVHAKGLNQAGPEEEVNIPPGFDPFPCRQCLVRNSNQLRSLRSCRQAHCFRKDPGKPKGYCLPLAQGAQPVGLLHIVAPSQQDFDARQLELLEYIAPEMSNSLYTTVEISAREDEMLTRTVRSVQREIARDLHDTVGQNISYLRMKLEHLSETNQKTEVAITEIRNMSNAANESYDTLRGTLASLQAGDTADLLHLFTQHADLVSERSSFKINISSLGEPKFLPSYTLRQCFYIFREALSNIEKYAGASLVRVKLGWDDNHLAIAIVDDGCGFDLAQIPKGGHYGMNFMRERIEHINGTFSIHSSIGAGAQIEVRVPYE
jgi:signal transduction histidine kinase